MRDVSFRPLRYCRSPDRAGDPGRGQEHRGPPRALHARNVPGLSQTDGFGFTLALLGVLLAIGCLAQLPAGVRPRWTDPYRTALRTLWPQAWSFFAETADTAGVTAVRLSPSGTAAADSGGTDDLNLSASNNWGLGRTTEARYREVQYLASLVPAAGWTDCAEPLASRCLATAKPVPLTDSFRPALVCGSFALLKASPGATAGAVAVVRVRCDR